MDQNEQQLQSVGICHRLFCFIMKNLASQALKPVTLGSPASFQQTRNLSRPSVDRQELNSRSVDPINDEAEDSESLDSIVIKDETSRLLGAEGGSWWYDQGNIVIENVGESKTKAPRKMVSIKDEPEIIDERKKRKNGPMERRNNGELRPLKSILKVGSNLSKSSTQVNGNAMSKATME